MTSVFSLLIAHYTSANNNNNSDDLIPSSSSSLFVLFFSLGYALSSPTEERFISKFNKWYVLNKSACPLKRRTRQSNKYLLSMINRIKHQQCETRAWKQEIHLLLIEKSVGWLSVYLLAFFSPCILLLNSKSNGKRRRGTSTRRPLQRPLFDVQQVKEEEEEEEFFFFSFLSFSFVVRWYRQTKRCKAFDSFDRLHFSFFSFAAAWREKQETSDSDISTPREKEKYLSTIRESTTRKRRGNIQHHHHHQHKGERQIDVWLVQVILSRVFFSSVRSLLCYCLLYDVLTCVFFLLLFLSLSRLLCFGQFLSLSLSRLHRDAIITLLDDLVDYFSWKQKQQRELKILNTFISLLLDFILNSSKILNGWMANTATTTATNDIRWRRSSS